MRHLLLGILLTLCPTVWGQSTVNGGAGTIKGGGTIGVSGSVGAQFSASPSSCPEGSIPTGTTAYYTGCLVTVTNTGSANLTFSGISLTGTNAADFSFTWGFDDNVLANGVPASFCVTGMIAVDGPNGAVYTCSGSSAGTSGTWSSGGALLAQVVNPVGSNTAPECLPGIPVSAGSSCVIALDFVPAASGSRSATLQFTDNAPGSPHTIALTGTGSSCSGTNLPAPPALLAANTTYCATANVACNDSCYGMNGVNIKVNGNGFNISCGNSPAVSFNGCAIFYAAFSSDTALGSSCSLSGQSHACLDNTTATTNFAGSEEVFNFGTATVAANATTAANKMALSYFFYAGSQQRYSGSSSNIKIHDIGNVVIPVYCYSCAVYSGFEGSNSTYNGPNDKVWKTTTTNNSGFNYQRCDYAGFSFIIGNNLNQSAGPVFYENTESFGPQGMLETNVQYAAVFGNVVNQGNPSGTSAGGGGTCSGIGTGTNGTMSASDSGIEMTAPNGHEVNNIFDPYEGRGPDMNNGGGSNNIVNISSAGDFSVVTAIANYAEYSGCEVGGTYAQRLNTFSTTGSTIWSIQNENLTVLANQCEGAALSISGNASTGNFSKNVKATCALATGHTVGIFCTALQVDDLAYPTAVLFTSTNDTYTGDTMDVAFNVDGGAGGPWVCYSCTFIKPATATSTNLGPWVTFSFNFGNVGVVHMGPVYTVDPTYSGGAAENSNDMSLASSTGASGQSASQYFMYTYTPTFVKASNSAPVSGVVFTAVDNQGGSSNALGTAYGCTTGGLGSCSTIVNENLYAFTAPSAPTLTHYNPIVFTVTSVGSSGCTIPSPYSRTITSTLSETITLAGC